MISFVYISSNVQMNFFSQLIDDGSHVWTLLYQDQNSSTEFVRQLYSFHTKFLYRSMQISNSSEIKDLSK